ncbi:MAG TPA: endolytic transglycosylase MltG [Mycobacteriales bacterium]|nr:endolytic transglycosylase MltG [Mycobacteriales bacterium]
MSDLSIFGVEYDEGPTRAERRRQQRRRKRRNPLGPLLGVVVIIALVGGILYGGKRVLGGLGDTPDYQGAGTGVVTVQVRSGDTAADIATTLTKLGVVKSEKAFRNAAKKDPRSPSIQPGFYKLHKQMSGQSAVTLLLDPAARLQSKFTVPEGLPTAEALKIISSKAGVPLAQLQAAAKNTAALGLPDYAHGRLEGFLFPATYELDPGTSAVKVLQTMVATYKQRVDDTGLSAAAGALGINPYQLLTVASLVEEEAITVDFTKVARVVYNRVQRGQRLELDSTINYALHRNRVKVSLQDTQISSPYNTYRRTGLPPTPICNPGVVAIQAALHPAAGNWLYFVKINKSGQSYFTPDYQDFLAHKAQAQSSGVF